VLDFGVFPGKSDASVAVVGQAGIVAGSTVNAWLRPIATADHSADEHVVETLAVYAKDIVAGTGFTIFGKNTNQVNEPVYPVPKSYYINNEASLAAFVSLFAPPSVTFDIGGGGDEPMVYGLWTVSWLWS
jgi:hypothetical protein